VSERPSRRGLDPVQTFVGGALMALGGLIAALCGLCTLGVIGFGVVDTITGGPTDDLMGGAVIVAIIGGLPTAAGVLLFMWGRRLYRRRNVGD
jgi:hypothetical protein